MIAFHFPPLAGSSGVQRTLRFVQHLPAFGWQPVVLTAHPRAYEQVSADLLKDVPSAAIVERAFALDAARHLAIGRRYPGFVARPDRWTAWALGAIPAGLQLIRRFRPEIIWSTYPIATAHLIGHCLHRLTGVPLVVDYRDPMTHVGYPEDAQTWRAYRRIESRAVRTAARTVLVTPSARQLYRDRYPDVPAERFELIENGFDEETFRAAEHEFASVPLNPGCFTLLHSGIVYPSERDPRALFEALGRMRAAGEIDSGRFRIRFRSPVHGELLAALAAESRTADMVEILPPIPYRDALREMICADGLMVMQAANCNEQVPAKLYEYLRAGRPILGLADPVGDTAKVMRDAGVLHIGKLEDPGQVESTLRRYLSDARAGTLLPVAVETVSGMSRVARAQALARVFDSVSTAAMVDRTRAGKVPC